MRFDFFNIDFFNINQGIHNGECKKRRCCHGRTNRDDQ